MEKLIREAQRLSPSERRRLVARLERSLLRQAPVGMRSSSGMVRVPTRFVDETLWPEFQQLSATLRGYLDEITERVVCEVLHGDSFEAEEVVAPLALPARDRARFGKRIRGWLAAEVASRSGDRH